MNFKVYQNNLKRIGIGKKLPDALYLHVSALEIIPASLNDYLNNIVTQLGLNKAQWNIIKFHKKAYKISLLNYPKFEEDAYPTLVVSYTINLESLTYKKTSYANSKNPPILHRKELFVLSTHPNYKEFREITLEGEKAGLYKNSKIIGFKKTWENIIKNKGYELINGRLKETNDSDPINNDENIKIERHRTAIARNSLSKPMQTLLRHNYLNGRYSIFDYGCGRGDDVRILKDHKINVSGWDPVYSPKGEKSKTNIVNLGFVINIIEDPHERSQTIKEAYKFASQLLVISAMLGGDNVIKRHQDFGDGVITSRKTFQKYFNQKELGLYIQDTLDETPIAVAPGIFYVFKDKLEEQQFLVERQKVKRTWEKLTYVKDPDRVKIKKLAIYERHKELFNEFWTQCLDLGRIPANSEFSKSEKIRSICNSHTKAAQVLFEAYDPKQLDRAAKARKDDLLVYFALGMFGRRKPYKNMPETLQRDIKEFFSLYTNALEEAKKLLFSVGRPDKIKKASGIAYEELKVGWFVKGHSYTIYRSLIEKLPAILRIYIGCATQLYGDIDDVDLVKIHMTSGKVSLMRYDDFANKSLPLLMERIKIKLRELDVDFFDYGDEFPPQPLYLKSQYLTPEFKNYKKQVSFDNKLSSFQWLDLRGFGPSTEEFEEQLKENNIKLSGYKISKI